MRKRLLIYLLEWYLKRCEEAYEVMNFRLDCVLSEEAIDEALRLSTVIPKTIKLINSLSRTVRYEKEI